MLQIPTIQLPLGRADLSIYPINLIPYEDSRVKKAVGAGFGFGPLPIFLALAPGLVKCPSRWDAEREQTALLRDIGWTAKFEVANIAGAFKRPDWDQYTLPTGPVQWPEYVPEPPKKTATRSSGKSCTLSTPASLDFPCTL